MAVSVGNRRKKGTLTPWFDEIVRLNATINDSGLKLLERLASAVETNDTAAIPGIVDKIVQIDPGDYWDTVPLVGIRLVDEVSDDFFDDLQARLVFLGNYASYRRIFEWWQPKRRSRRTEVTWQEWLWSELCDIAASGVFVLKQQNAIDSQFLILNRTLDAFFRDYQRDVMRRSARQTLMEDIFKTLIDALQLAFQLRIDQISADIANKKTNERLVRKLRKQFASVSEVFARHELGKGWAVFRVFETAKYKLTGKNRFYVDYFSESSARKANALPYFYYKADEYSLEDARSWRVKESLEMRERQIEFFEFLYGISTLAPHYAVRDLQDAVMKALKALPKKQRLDSDEFWIALLPPVFEAFFTDLLQRLDAILKKGGSAGSQSTESLAREQESAAPGLRARAWTSCLYLLRWYFDTFAEHSKYDLRDFGKSYLDTAFPATGTGRLLHDCGVYAVRIAYIIGASSHLISKRTKRQPGTLSVQGSFVLMPFHVGLVLETSEGTACITNNGDFEVLLSDKIERLKERWTLTDDDGNERAQAVPLDETSFWGDLTASKFIDSVDMPFKIVKISGLSAPKTAVKREAWRTYVRRVVPTNRQLFSPGALRPPEEEFEIALAYLQLLQLKKEWYNKFFVPFWNGEAIPAWLKFGPQFDPLLKKVSELQKKIDKANDALAAPGAKFSEREKKRRSASISKMEAQARDVWAQFERLRLDYLNVLMVGDGEVKKLTKTAGTTRLDYLSNKGLEGLRKGEKELDELRARVEQYLDTNPGAINKGANRSRNRKVSEVGGRHGEVFTHIERVVRVVRGASSMPEPPFSSREARLDRIPE